MRLLACLIVAPQRGYDEPAILSYAISSFCPTSADGLQATDGYPLHRGGRCGGQSGVPLWRDSGAPLTLVLPKSLKSIRR